MDGGEAGCHARRKRMTDATTPTLKPIPLDGEGKNRQGLQKVAILSARDARFY